MPTFTRGQWTQYGSGSYYGACWRSSGTEKILTGQTIPSGTTLGDYIGNSSLAGKGVFVTFTQGGVWDTTNSRWYAGFSGGGSGFVNFDLNVFDMATGTWNPNGRPQRAYTELGIFAGSSSNPASNYPIQYCLFGITPECPGGIVDVNNRYADLADVNPDTGTRLLPNWGHNNGSPVWFPTVQRFGIPQTGGNFWGDFGANPGMWEYDVATSKWALNFHGNDAYPDQGFNTAGCSCWDSQRNRALVVSPQNNNVATVYAYNPSQPIGSRVTRMPALSFSLGVTSYPTCVYDSRRDHMRVYGKFNGVAYQHATFDFSSSATNPTITYFQTTGTFPWAESWGVLYDPISDRDILWTGGLNLYSLHPVTHVGETITGAGDNPGNPSGLDPGQTIPSVWNRFAYLPQYDVYAVIPRENTSGVYVYAPTRSTPALAFTDLVRGPRTGNADTSQGQTANVNGAIVSVFGENLGTSQGSSTLTIGGVAPAAIYYWGAATPPNVPAALSNSYQALQMITFQVPSTCPLGTQNIAVTVNGLTSNSLTFTVASSGNILFSNSFGSFQSAVDAMAAGDILYVRDGVNVTSFSTSDLSSTMTAIVAFPGATCTFGNGVSDPLPSGYGANVQNRTYAKLTIIGGNGGGGQAATIGDSARIVGCKFTAPNGHGSSGTLGVFGSNVSVLGCEFANCGTGPPADDQYHVIYRYGRRSQPTPFPESGYRAAYNYIHDCAASRAFNCFNGENPEFNNNPIGNHEIDHNVIVNQQWAGVGLLDGVVGTNLVHDNLFINCGLSTGTSSGIAAGIQLNAGYPGTWSGATSPITIHCYNNTLVNTGDAGVPTARGVFYIASATRYSLLLHNNIITQPNGIEYVKYAFPSDVLTADATKRSNNLWFGAGTAPGLDSSALNVNPQLFSVSAPYNLHLQNTSPAIGAGVNLSPLAAVDFDGITRPASGAWDLGAYQFAPGSGSQPPTPNPATIAISYDGKLRDRVGQGNAALAPDGALDGTVTVQLIFPTGKTVTYARCDVHDTNGASIGIWDTDNTNVYWVSGCASSLDATYLNNASNMSVNFFLDDGSSFKMFMSDFNGIEFLDANTLTITLQFSDGTSAIKTVTIGSTPEPPIPTPTFNFQTMFMYGQGA